MSYTYHLEYVGNATVDKRLSNPMVPWIIAQIRRGDNQHNVSVRVEHGTIEVRKEDTNVLICLHSLQLVSRLIVQPAYIFYAVRDKEQPLLYCHLFQSTDQHSILDMMATMKEQSNKLQSRTTTALCPDISPSSSHFFEVLYVGRIKVSHKIIPDTFIDDALEKFRNLEKTKKEREQSEAVENEALNGNRQTYGSTEVLQSETENDCDNPRLEKTRRRSGSLGSILIKKDHLSKDNGNGLQPEMNRTMVFHVGKNDLRLISPDRKQVLLFKYLKDITNPQQGMKNPTHFGFFCKENGKTEPPSFIAYVFNCQCSSVAEDLVSAIGQASLTDKKTTVVSCERCPMVWYHKLCSELEGLSDKGMEEAVNRRLETLPPDEQAIVHMKLQGAELPQGNAKEYIQLVMMLLRAHCESKQARHVHDTPENRHEFLSHYLGGGTIFMKAKRSLTSSFDQLLKRKSSSNDFNQSLSLPPNTTLKDIVQEVNRNHSPSNETIDGSANEEPTSPGSMMNIFMKLGNSPRTPSIDSRLDEGGDVLEQPRSWRQAIFQNVVTPSKVLQGNIEKEAKKRDKQSYRELWRKAINQQVLLIRMEKENAKLTERQEEANVKRIKLEYAEIGTVEPSDVWEIIIKDDKKLESTMILNAVKTGIPKAKRGEVWLHLTKQRTSKIAPFNSSNFPNYNVSYEQLLKQLTSHQHSILIDLGRTFPSHSYFRSPLGPGQLALFNLLKAYSLLDPEVGYCQGLSFIAAVLLLHMSESEAFFVLKHLMFRQGIRSRYLPDMTALQVSLYQLSRLLHDRHPDLYAHFDSLDVAPTLYAAPWLLTLFASQFPLGFVARVFDLMFADSPIVLFKIALALLGIHKADLLECDSFESIMDYLKVKLPQIDTPAMDRLVKEVMSTDITKEMNEYGVEYHVLQEEMTAPRPELKRLRELEDSNKALKQQVGGLNQQLQIASSNINRLEASRSFHMSQLNKLESQVKCLEVTVSTLGQFISDLGYSNKDVQIPNEILRILTQINISQKKKIMRPQMSSPEFSAADLKRVKEELEAKKAAPVVALGRNLTEEDKAAMVARKESRVETATINRPPDESVAQLSKPLKSTQSSFELGSNHFHPLDTNGVHTSFGGTSHLKKIQLQKNNRSKSSKNIELKIIEAPSEDQVSEKLKLTKNKVTRLFESCNDVFKKDHGHEAQLLIKSQALKTKNSNGVS